MSKSIPNFDTPFWRANTVTSHTRCISELLWGTSQSVFMRLVKSVPIRRMQIVMSSRIGNMPRSQLWSRVDRTSAPGLQLILREGFSRDLYTTHLSGQLATYDITSLSHLRDRLSKPLNTTPSIPVPPNVVDSLLQSKVNPFCPLQTTQRLNQRWNGKTQGFQPCKKSENLKVWLKADHTMGFYKLDNRRWSK